MPASRRLRSLLGLLLVPLLAAGGFGWATWHFDTRLDRVEAAVVNLDKPVTLNGQLVPLGRQLAGGLVEGPEEENFRWTLTDQADATAGLTAGRYAAVVTIPQDFSARATSFAKNDADAAERATIEVQTSEVSGIADPVVGRAITAAATRALNTSLTEQYLKNIYLGFNRLSGQFGTLADGAGKLAAGTADLSGGLRQSAAGSAELADGLTGLDQGANQLAGGAARLSKGVSALGAGLGKLSGGLTRTADGADHLADGADDLTKGARRLARGADGLSAGVDALRNGTASRPGGTRAYAAGAADFAAGLGQYSDQLSAYPGRTDAQLAKAVPCPAELPQVSCPAFYAGLRAGTTVAAQGLADRNGQPGLVTGAEQLSRGAKGIDTGVGRLSAGTETYATGVHRYAKGVGALAAGTERLAGGIDRLARGTAASALGARELATGAAKLSSGTSELATATGLSADGAKSLSDGLGQLSGGSESLAKGTKKFADGLAKGERQVPTYSAAERNRLSGVVSAPVTEPAAEGATYSDIAITTLLLVLALWLGGLAAFAVLRPVTRRVLTSMKLSWRLAFEALAPAAAIAAVQAVVLSGTLHVLLDLTAGQTAALVPFAVLIGLTFVAVNQALAAALGGLGRVLSVLAAVVVAAGALSGAAPALFVAAAPYLPLTPALQGVRALVSDGGSIGPAVGVLVGWLLLAVSISVLAVARRRILPAGGKLAPALGT
jgi:putative membrane protein